MTGTDSGARPTSGTMLQTCRWALSTAWATSPGSTLGLCATLLVRAVVPAGLAVAARGLINAVVGMPAAGGDPWPIVTWLLVGFACALGDSLTPLANQFFHQRLADDLNLELTSDVLHHAAALDLGSLEDPRLQDTIDRAQQGTASAFSTLIRDLQIAAADGLQVLLAAAILLYLEPLVLLLIGPFAVPYLLFRGRTARHRYAEEAAWATKRRWTRYFVSHLTGQTSAAETALLGLGPLFLSRFRGLMTETRDRDRVRYRRDLAAGSLFTLLTTIGFYLLFARVALQVVAGALTVGDIALYAGVATRLRLNLERVIGAVAGITEHALHLGNLKAFLELPSRMSATGGAAPPPRGEIELADVSFTYPGSTTPAISGVSLHIEPGEVIALVGENGAGKTTLIKLIARLYDADRGCVRVDGVDVRLWSLEQLRQRIAFLYQGFARYEATAADNIAFGDWPRLLERRDRVQEVASFAGCDDVIRAMPRGYDTMLGRMFGEHDLSGGQWQKLAVARTLARDAPVLILDEPTTNLDARAEYDLFSHFRELARGRTTILISHRLTTLAMADRILVMEHGRIVEAGAHRDLLARSGTYAKLFDMHQMQTGTP